MGRGRLFWQKTLGAACRAPGGKRSEDSAITRKTLLRYGSALLAVILATAVRSLLDPWMEGRFPVGSYYVGLVVVAWYGGLGPALVALVLSMVAIPVLDRHVSGAPWNWQINAEMSAWRYLLAGMAVALLGGSMRAAQRRAEAQELRTREALDAERAQRERLRVTLQSISDGIIVTDPEEHVTSLNPVAERLTGWTQAEAAGKPLKQVFRTIDHSTHRTAEMPVSEVMQVGVAHTMEQTLLVPRGKETHPLAVEHGTAPIRDQEGEITGAVIVFRDVTQRRRAELALRQSEERFSRFMQHLPGLAWIKDLSGRYVFANDAALKAFATTRTELYGKDDRAVFAPEVAEQFQRNDRKALSAGAGLQVVETLAQRDGIVHHSVVSKFPISGSSGDMSLVGGIAIDITDLKHAEEALRQSEENFRTLADSIPQLAWMARPDGSIFWYNRRWYEYTGTTPEQVEGWGWKLVHDPLEYPRVLKGFLEAIARGESWEDTFPLRRHDGALRWHLSRALPVRDDQGRVVRWFGTNTDITDRREMEEALREADRRKDEFLATLAHELRNPLAPLRNTLYLMRQRSHQGEGFDDDCVMAERQVVHLARLVDDLMDIARITRGKIELRREEIDLATVLRRAVETSRSALDEQRHSLTLSLPEQPVRLVADPTRLEQVFWNLLNNAAKYTEPGGQIGLAVECEGSQVVVRVRDTGIGIEREMLPTVFEMFVQAGHRSHSARTGLGIGLSLVKSLVQLHGGSIAAQSEGVGRGSEFVVRLPVLPAEAAPASGPTSRPGRSERPGLPRWRVLVVDDNLDAASSLARVLTRVHGQDVRVAHDGPSALEAAEQFQPHAVLLDIGMPGMDGYELARRLRLRFDREPLLLVALTGWGQENDRARSRDSGIDHHLVKPVDPDDLERVLRELDAQPT